MHPAGRYFQLADGETAGAVTERLEALGLTATPASVVRRVYLDSVDWRALREGHVVYHETGEGGGRLETHALAEGPVPLVAPMEKPPRFASELSLPAMKTRVASLVGVRRLFPVVDLQCERKRFLALDGHDKTVCGVVLERWRARAKNGSRRRPLLARVGVVPVKGYPAAAERLARVLEGKLGLPPMVRGLLHEALAALQVPTEGLAPPRGPGLCADTTTAEALSGLFDEQLRIMEANLDGVCQDYDPEFLHDFRIAVRKTRTLLGQVKELFPAGTLDEVREGFAWLSGFTGPARDADVYFLGFDALRSSLPEGMQADILPLKELLRVRRAEHHEALSRALRSERYRRLIDSWRGLVEEIGTSRDAAWERPVRELALARIRKLTRRVLREGRGLDLSSEDERYHELRKTGKKLRYLMEFFRPCLDEGAIGPAIQRLRRLQGTLGRFQDSSTQVATFRGYAEEMQTSGVHRAATLMAMGVVIERLKERKAAARRSFGRRFRSFARRAGRISLESSPPAGARIRA